MLIDEHELLNRRADAQAMAGSGDGVGDFRSND